jgi:hypothetical protein
MGNPNVSEGFVGNVCGRTENVAPETTEEPPPHRPEAERGFVGSNSQDFLGEDFENNWPDFVSEGY